MGIEPGVYSIRNVDRGELAVQYGGEDVTLFVTKIRNTPDQKWLVAGDPGVVNKLQSITPASAKHLQTRPVVASVRPKETQYLWRIEKGGDDTWTIRGNGSESVWCLNVVQEDQHVAFQAVTEAKYRTWIFVKLE